MGSFFLAAAPAEPSAPPEGRPRCDLREGLVGLDQPVGGLAELGCVFRDAGVVGLQQQQRVPVEEHAVGLHRKAVRAQLVEGLVDQGLVHTVADRGGRGVVIDRLDVVEERIGEERDRAEASHGVLVQGCVLEGEGF